MTLGQLERLAVDVGALVRQRVTMVFQSGALFDSLTVAENILFSLELREDYDADSRHEVVDGLLSLVGLQDYGDSLPLGRYRLHARGAAMTTSGVVSYEISSTPFDVIAAPPGPRSVATRTASKRCCRCPICC